MRNLFVLLGLLSAGLHTAIADSPSDLSACEALFQQTLAESMTLDYQGFDQTPGQGFRILAGARCPKEAADLIEVYIEINNATENSLTWHLAQMRGEAGQIEAAIAAATRTLDNEESPDQAFRWNAHVQAYLAMLAGNRAQFDVSLDELKAATESHRGNAMNASFWDRLAPYFERGYAGALQAAYSQ